MITRDQMARSALIAVVALTLSVSCEAQDGRSNHFRPHFSGQAPGEAQAIFRQFKGSVSAVEPKAMMLTIKLAKEARVFKVTDNTKFTAGHEPALFKDIGVGKTVEVVVKTVHGQTNETVSVKIIPEQATGTALGR